MSDLLNEREEGDDRPKGTCLLSQTGNTKEKELIYSNPLKTQTLYLVSQTQTSKGFTHDDDKDPIFL